MPARKRTKPRKLTNREKAANAAFKRMFQAEGVLPPNKPRLNRKKFAREVVTEFNEVMISFGDHEHLIMAISFMVAANMKRVTSEEVGVLKVLKMAIEIKKFMESRTAEGKTSYKVGELYEVISPILRL